MKESGSSCPSVYANAKGMRPYGSFQRTDNRRSGYSAIYHNPRTTLGEA